MLWDKAASHQVLLDDPLQNRRIASRVPRTLGIYNGDRSLFANSKAIRFRAVETSLLGKSELPQPTLEIIPSFKGPLLVAALGFGLIAAEEYVPAGRWNPQGFGNCP